MIKRKVDLDRGMEIDLTGPDGNTFILLGKAKRLAEEIGLDPLEVTGKMNDGDYEHLVKTMDQYFGHIITFYR